MNHNNTFDMQNNIVKFHTLCDLLNQNEVTLMGDCLEKIKQWISSPVILHFEKTEILDLLEKKDLKELRDRFYKELEFGTGGLRGITGAGNNRMNPAVVRRATQGLANYIVKNVPDLSSRKVAIAFDSRNRSEEFAKIAAFVLSKSKIKVYLFDTCQTTPCLSYAVRSLNCVSGLCVTASHNPPNYHGYKVYWNDGAQITAPQDKGIIDEVFALSDWEPSSAETESELRNCGLIQSVPKEVIENYYEQLCKLTLCKKDELDQNIKIVYTPLHGTGAEPTREMMKRLQYTNLTIVPEQEFPNGDFPTVQRPNPEEPAALILCIQLAQKIDADICLATDPDSDRLALIVKDPTLSKTHFKDQAVGDFILLNGNQTGALLLEFLLERRRTKGLATANDAVIKTIVTSELLRHISAEYGVTCDDTLTGFKWIARLIRQWEVDGSPKNFIFGTEESFGYMPGSYVRDKDGIGALCLAVEMAAFYKKRNLTCAQQLLNIFARHGTWKEDLISYDLVGEAGSLRIAAIMTHMRTHPPLTFCNLPVKQMLDFKTATSKTFLNDLGTNLNEPKTMKLSIPQSDVLQFQLLNGTRVSMRPSGTEPKLKIYLSVCSNLSEGVDTNFAKSQNGILKLRSEITKAIEAIP